MLFLISLFRKYSIITSAVLFKHWLISQMCSRCSYKYLEIFELLSSCIYTFSFFPGIVSVTALKGCDGILSQIDCHGGKDPLHTFKTVTFKDGLSLRSRFEFVRAALASCASSGTHGLAERNDWETSSWSTQEVPICFHT